MQPLAATLPGIAPACPQPSSDRQIHASNRRDAWRADLERRVAQLLAYTNDTARIAKIEAAYQAELQRGPGFARVRRQATFAEPSATKLSREGLARLERAWAYLTRKLTDSDRQEARLYDRKLRRTISRSTIDVLNALIWMARKHPAVFPSLERLARLANISRRTATDALATLEAWGVLHITRRRKRIRTATGGIAETQDTNVYVLTAPSGLAAMALAIFGWKSECKNRSATSTTHGLSEQGGSVAPATRTPNRYVPLPERPTIPATGRIPWYALLRR